MQNQCVEYTIYYARKGRKSVCLYNKKKTLKNKPKGNENDYLWKRKVTGLENTSLTVGFCNHVNILCNYKTN